MLLLTPLLLTTFCQLLFCFIERALQLVLQPEATQTTNSNISVNP
jgi:hypothetical protein